MWVERGIIAIIIFFISLSALGLPFPTYVFQPYKSVYTKTLYNQASEISRLQKWIIPLYQLHLRYIVSRIQVCKFLFLAIIHVSADFVASWLIELHVITAPNKGNTQSPHQAWNCQQPFWAFVRLLPNQTCVNSSHLSYLSAPQSCLQLDPLPADHDNRHFYLKMAATDQL